MGKMHESVQIRNLQPQQSSKNKLHPNYQTSQTENESPNPKVLVDPRNLECVAINVRNGSWKCHNHESEKKQKKQNKKNKKI